MKTATASKVVMSLLEISRSQEFTYRIGHPIAVVGEVFTYPSQLCLKELVKIIKPLTKVSSNSCTRKAIEIAQKVLRSFFLLLSLPYHLTVGLTGFGLCILACFFRKKITLISEARSQNNLKESKNLTVSTFNTALLPDFINALKPVGPHIHPIDGSLERRVGAIADAILIRDDDIVCLQEVFDPRAERLLIRHLSKKYPHIAYHVGPKAILLNSGLMILSKKPISEARFRPFSIIKGVDRWAGKGVMAVSVELGQNRQLTILNTHLNSDTGTFGWISNIVAIRNAQLKDIKKLEEEFTIKSNGKEVQQIICGDFNKRSVKIDGYQVVSGEFDHILVSERGSHCTDIQDKQIDPMGESSDHPAVIVTLTV